MEKFDENWLPVYGAPEYMVNIRTGEVYSSIIGRMLNQNTTYNGYYTVSIRRKRRKVHRVVLSSVTNGIPEGMTVNHIDGDKHNNCIDNLEWCTQGENNRHATRTGLHPHKNYVTRRDRQLDDEDVIKIRFLISQGIVGCVEIREFVPKATPKNIYAIKHGLSYAHVEDNAEVIQSMSKVIEHRNA